MRTIAADSRSEGTSFFASRLRRAIPDPTLQLARQKATAMKLPRWTLVLPLLLAPLAFAAPELTPATQKARGLVPAETGPVFEGRSVDGDMQAAIDDALHQMEQFTAQTGADLQMRWEIERIHGIRGGIVGSQEIRVQVRMLR